MDTGESEDCRMSPCAVRLFMDNVRFAGYRVWYDKKLLLMVGITRPFPKHLFPATIIRKASDFPALPVDYGYRDSKNFWYHRKARMRAELLPIREASLQSVRYAADRADDTVKFTDDALKKILNVPRVFLPLVLKGCVDWAKENNVTLITEKEMQIIQDKRAKEKEKKNKG